MKISYFEIYFAYDILNENLTILWAEQDSEDVFKHEWNSTLNNFYENGYDDFFRFMAIAYSAYTTFLYESFK